ncbi:MAG: alanine racemase [Alphaproteobacteria bacterium]|nr:alanine racemase [Alphaproteobacteria bacterium]
MRDRPVLSVSLGAIGANWQALREMAPRAETSAVVKADGYGLGAEQAARRLKALGCETFFVATRDEGRALRPALGGAPRIFVLNGLPPGAATDFVAHGLTPVLNTFDEVREWTGQFPARPAALHLDTGMARAGLSAEELDALLGDPGLLARLNLALVMSHLACADEPEHPKNGEQLARFRGALGRLPPAPASLAGSGGILLGADYHFDLTRPGIALYGGNPQAQGANPMRAAATLTAEVLGVRTLQPGETAGYGATFAAESPRRLAVCNIGYADGLLRALSNRGVAFIDGIACPYAGRVSMDLLTLDVTGVPAPRVGRGTAVEIIGPHMTVERMAALAGTANYEVLTGLGGRFARAYPDGPAGRTG